MRPFQAGAEMGERLFPPPLRCECARLPPAPEKPTQRAER